MRACVCVCADGGHGCGSDLRTCGVRRVRVGAGATVRADAAVRVRACVSGDITERRPDEEDAVIFVFFPEAARLIPRDCGASFRRGTEHA